MVVILAIGRFFKKIWDWIKQTAWIQPLLIVGIIFGVIFSIPSIVDAANKSKEERAKYERYFDNYRISLEYDQDQTSEADRFTDGLLKIMDNPSDTEAVKTFKDEFGDRTGDKFFVSFVGKSCDKCEVALEGFSLFEKLLNKDEAFMTGKGESFHMVTIFADDETSYATEEQPAFFTYVEKHSAFFEEIGAMAYDLDYYKNQKINDADLEALENADPKEFLTPTILLVELGDMVHDEIVGAGVQEIMFGVGTESDDQNYKADLLFDCWTHTGDFDIND